jgi:hypothetical protein
MEPLLDGGWPADFTFSDIVQELVAIANGDDPRILKGEASRASLAAPTRFSKEAPGAYLVQGAGRTRSKGGVRRELIEDCFATLFDTYNSWRQEGRRKLGSEYLDWLLTAAVQTKS